LNGDIKIPDGKLEDFEKQMTKISGVSIDQIMTGNTAGTAVYARYIMNGIVAERLRQFRLECQADNVDPDHVITAIGFFYRHPKWVELFGIKTIAQPLRWDHETY